MAYVQYFKTTRDSPRFNSNQKVWIKHNYANHMIICFKWRGKGRYVEGHIDKWWNSVIGEIKTIEVDDSFRERHGLDAVYSVPA